MPKILRNKSIRKIFIVIGVIAVLALIVYLAMTGRRYFSRRGIRQIQLFLSAYGALSPIAVILLILITTLIPPLPIPTPLIEMAAGYIYGFWPAFFLVWISQIVSSLAAYGVTKFVGRKIFRKILQNPIVAFYQEYVKENGAIAVFITRSTMSSPFNIVSFLAGLTHIPFTDYAFATILGTIIESALFSFVGSLIRHIRLRLSYVFILVVIVGAIGPLLTYGVMKLLQHWKKRRT